MTDQSDILNSGITVAPQLTTENVVTSDPSTAPVVDPIVEKLRSIKNEDGLQKYASVEDALTGTVHAQEYIRTLKEDKVMLQAQMDQLRQEYEARQAQLEVTTQQASTQSQEPPAQRGVGREDIYSIMEGYEQAKVRKGNRKSVVDTLVQHCNGDQVKASEYITSKLSELNMTREQLADLSEHTPTAVYKLFGMDGKGTNSTTSSLGGTINTDAVALSNSHREMVKPKPLPIGATRQQVVDQWRQAIAGIN
jgi:vacuolar-type H+-ATPase subunit I/STV1